MQAEAAAAAAQQAKMKPKPSTAAGTQTSAELLHDLEAQSIFKTLVRASETRAADFQVRIVPTLLG